MRIQYLLSRKNATATSAFGGCVDTRERIFAVHAPPYAEQHFSVLPLNNKIPAIRGGHGVKDATSDSARVDEWSSSYAECNIGIACGHDGLIVIDIDPRNGGHRTMARLADGGHHFPICPEVVTGNRGRHLYLRVPDGVVPSMSSLGEGIDVQWRGKYVVAPPSVTGPSGAGPGGRYQWMRDLWSYSLPPMPDWAITRLLPPKPKIQPIALCDHPGLATRRLHGLADFVAKAQTGI